MISISSLSAALFYASLAAGLGLEAASVTLDYGTFAGLVDLEQRIVYFRGVRYADPPRRWTAPVSPPTRHLGHVQATTIYAPTTTTADNPLPVLVYFHGGGFEDGSTHDYAPEHIMQSSVNPLVFVTFEFRQGPLGFLGGAAVKKHGSLNVGLLDQQAALRWVQRYIRKFGGDPAWVTIWGESGGAGATMFHLIGSDPSLFHQAMGNSPSLNYLPAYDDPYVESLFTEFAQNAGCLDLDCLRSVPADTIAAAGQKVLASHPATLYPFAPVFDGAFFTQRPVEAFSRGQFAQVPVLFGSNTDEGAGWSASLADGAANTSSHNATQATVYRFLRGQYAALSQKSFDTAVRLHYPLAAYGGSVGLQAQQMYGELRYICTAVLVTGSARPAYHYRWDNPSLGSHHAADLAAFFWDTSAFGSADRALIDAMRRYFTSFVTDGAPAAADAVVWAPVSSAHGSPRLLLNPSEMRLEPVPGDLRARCAFWHGIAVELRV
ncbi:unnamed protein product [Mycena citricolor]|uniref:Carboxylic ester hydrolase n=1 Tax=Mycena citricolor TaxID=2018698 RepID=A0AAD2HLW2_9AGAR|nr:unnamed protein product [Mycena citricolor]